MTNKQDIILNHIIEIKADIAGMKQHLKGINSSVKGHTKDISTLNKRQYWAFGVGAAIIFILSLGFKLIL